MLTESVGGLGSRREVESARKLLLASTKKLSKHIKETLLVAAGCVFAAGVARRRVNSLLSDSKVPVRGGRVAVVN